VHFFFVDIKRLFLVDVTLTASFLLYLLNCRFLIMLSHEPVIYLISIACIIFSLTVSSSTKWTVQLHFLHFLEILKVKMNNL